MFLGAMLIGGCILLNVKHAPTNDLGFLFIIISIIGMVISAI